MVNTLRVNIDVHCTCPTVKSSKKHLSSVQGKLVRLSSLQILSNVFIEKLVKFAMMLHKYTKQSKKKCKMRLILNCASKSYAVVENKHL